MHNFPKMFRIFVTKQTSRFCGMNRHVSWMDSSIINCYPICGQPAKSSKHITHCQNKAQQDLQMDGSHYRRCTSGGNGAAIHVRQEKHRNDWVPLPWRCVAAVCVCLVLRIGRGDHNWSSQRDQLPPVVIGDFSLALWPCRGTGLARLEFFCERPNRESLYTYLCQTHW